MCKIIFTYLLNVNNVHLIFGFFFKKTLLFDIPKKIICIYFGNIFRDRGNTGRDSLPIEHVIQDFFVNLSGLGWGPMGAGGRGNGPV